MVEHDATPAVRRPMGIGVDIVSVVRISAILRRYDDSLLERIFTAGELRRSHEHASRDLYLATCFGGKEAAGKALGCGLTDVDWPEIEVLSAGDRLDLCLCGAAAERAAVLGIEAWVGRRTTSGGLVVVCIIAIG